MSFKNIWLPAKDLRAADIQEQLSVLYAIRDKNHEALHTVMIVSPSFACQINMFDIMSFDAMLSVVIDLLEKSLQSNSSVTF